MKLQVSNEEIFLPDKLRLKSLGWKPVKLKLILGEEGYLHLIILRLTNTEERGVNKTDFIPTKLRRDPEGWAVPIHL